MGFSPIFFALGPFHFAFSAVQFHLICLLFLKLAVVDFYCHSLIHFNDVCSPIKFLLYCDIEILFYRILEYEMGILLRYTMCSTFFSSS